MQCPSCQQRKARRSCPALGRAICAVCCATKRLAEINCPPDCTYLASARVHPAAVVRRQQERDVAMLLPSIRHLTERQHQLFFLFHSVIARHTPEGFGRVQDVDVADAAGALAATLETAQRGVIYEHGAQSPVAQGLARAMSAMIEDIRAQGTRIYDGEGAIALRAIEQGARETAGATQAAAGEADPRAYLALVSRLLGGRPGGPQPAQDEPGGRAGSIILP
jgi:hypothetical protein